MTSDLAPIAVTGILLLVVCALLVVSLVVTSWRQRRAQRRAEDAARFERLMRSIAAADYADHLERTKGRQH